MLRFHPAGLFGPLTPLVPLAPSLLPTAGEGRRPGGWDEGVGAQHTAPLRCRWSEILFGMTLLRNVSYLEIEATKDISKPQKLAQFI
jgi:hypothetical protein